MGDWNPDPRDELIKSLMELNKTLTEALVSVTVPPPPPPQIPSVDPWGYDSPKPGSQPLATAGGAVLDMWAEENVPEGTGWVGFKSDPPEEENSVETAAE